MIEIFKRDKFFQIVFILSLLSLFRSLIIPLHGDEITYFKISENILKGKYFLENSPTTITPIVPLLFTFFKTSFNENVGLTLLKLLNISLFFGGLRFLFLFLKKQNVEMTLIIVILMLSICNPNSIAWFSSLYPESILFFCFWAFIHYYNSDINPLDFYYMLMVLGVLFLTRYVYGILGIFVIIYLISKINFFKTRFEQNKVYFIPIIIVGIPILIWFKYVYFIESNYVTEISYFHRFNSELSLWDNVKYGLGIGIHPEVSRVNGLPAFITLWIPITGYRNYFLSAFVLLIIICGYFTYIKSSGIKMLGLSTVLVMLGFVIAGTGFSRYWLILIPSFLIGIVLFLKYLKLSNNFILWAARLVALIYILNEIRIDYTIVMKYL